MSVGGRERVASVPDVELSELLDQIDEAALDGDVTRALLLCQKLAGHAGSGELRSWANNELTGYPSVDDLPTYRYVRGAMLGYGVAPMQRLSRVPIPSDMLPSDLVDEGILEMPLGSSISEIQTTAQQHSDLTLMPGHSGRLAQLVNALNQGTAKFEQIHFTCSSGAYEGIVTAVRAKLMSLTASLRESLPKGAALDDRRLQREVERWTININGDNNAVAMATDTARATAQPTQWWQPLWVKIVGGCGLVALVVIEEVWRRATIWPF